MKLGVSIEDSFTNQPVFGPFIVVGAGTFVGWGFVIGSGIKIGNWPNQGDLKSLQN